MILELLCTGLLSAVVGGFVGFFATLRFADTIVKQTLAEMGIHLISSEYIPNEEEPNNERFN